MPKEIFDALISEGVQLAPARSVALHLAFLMANPQIGSAMLHPNLRGPLQSLREYAEESQMPFQIVSTFRTFPEQEAIYGQGRTTAGKIVSNARGGESYHNYGLAFDVALLPGQGGSSQASALANLGAFWEKIGGVWGGDFGDTDHFEYHPGFEWQDLRPHFLSEA